MTTLVCTTLLPTPFFAQLLTYAHRYAMPRDLHCDCVSAWGFPLTLVVCTGYMYMYAELKTHVLAHRCWIWSNEVM